MVKEALKDTMAKDALSTTQCIFVKYDYGWKNKNILVFGTINFLFFSCLL